MDLPFRPAASGALRGSGLSRRSLRWASRHGLAQGLSASRIARHSIGNGLVQRRSLGTAEPSYVEGPREPPLLTQTIPQHFAEIVSQYGDRPAAIFRSPTDRDLGLVAGRTETRPLMPRTSTLTYSSLDTLTNVMAHSLRSLGVKKGDRVAVSLGNVEEHVVMTYAIFKLGAVLVPLNPTFNAHQLNSALSHLGIKVLVIPAITDLPYKPCYGRSNYDLLTAIVPNITRSKVESPTVPSLRTIVLVDNTRDHRLRSFPDLDKLRALTPYSSLLEWLATADKAPRAITPDTPLDPWETINIQFTSGTTSSPKAAMLSHTNILNNARFVAQRMGLKPDDKIVCPPPLFHCFGSVLGLGATVTAGACTVFPTPAFDPAATLFAAAETRATGLHGVPTMFASELRLMADQKFSERLPAGGLSLLRKGIAAGSSVPEPLMHKLKDKLGLHDLVVCYGMTETSPVSCMTSPDDPESKRWSTIGRAMPHTDIKIVAHNDRSQIVPRGERGELAVSGYLLMKGYYGDTKRTREDLVPSPGGRLWMYSGDEARMDADGYVEITGRIKDLIIRGGENINPFEVEVALARHQSIREAAVVGVPDEQYGEVVGAFVAADTGVQTLDDGVEGGEGTLSKNAVRDWVKNHLSGHLMPKYVFWMDEFPKTASGKIQRFRLRELAQELVGSKPR